MITSRGRELAKIVPIEDKRSKSRETLREIGQKAFIGDILSPIDEEWESMN
jgi:antitoxin (DNA-binding transcriptional repressor) of toxin-antitoxin stability system